MKLFTFGDSWTEGVGGNRKDEYSTDNFEQRTIIRQKYCWPTHLSELLKCEVKNKGVEAFSNNAIFNTVFYQLKNKIITQDDFVVIMWSSSLRDPLPFFPTEDDFFIWGNRYKSKGHLLKYLFDGIDGNNLNYNRAEKNFRDYYIGNLFSDTYYDIVNQNYILHLQFIFNQMGIRYLFCDAFDIMINKNIDTLVDKTHLIESDRYWGYQNKTMSNLLIETDRRDVWEDGNHWNETVSNKHPSNDGYKLIAEELYKFISENNLLTFSKSKNSHLL
jgi:lysophospholipase L1-like esterase